ncbi:hypothetical protein HW132_32580 [Brasilonema sp. CT11]|nr:hypothetical protein [Brasilonema sp. CT11]
MSTALNRLAVSFLSLSLMLPGFTALLSGTAEAQTNQNVATCPRNFRPRPIAQGEELRYIAKANTGSQKNWRIIINPKTQERFNESEAEELSEGDLICVPANWTK